jgi:hypothetical protein
MQYSDMLEDIPQRFAHDMNGVVVSAVGKVVVVVAVDVGADALVTSALSLDGATLGAVACVMKNLSIF